MSNALPELTGIHHVALITANYAASRRFYVDILGAQVISETWRPERQSYKLDVRLPGGAQLELFSFPSPPPRVDSPEACGLRHLAFGCTDIEAIIERLGEHGVPAEPLRVDALTDKRFTFVKDPDGTPIEFYEVA
ncbi:hypothetical protein R84981_002928 [Carnimonas sp. R-84981]|uniref:SMU1112c/YaeR family gloxylase I-like metalloprotein n=1 Tax=Carnimonas bestiolae TaxID=3402172 RepID=UPI003EDC5A02